MQLRRLEFTERLDNQSHLLPIIKIDVECIDVTDTVKNTLYCRIVDERTKWLFGSQRPYDRSINGVNTESNDKVIRGARRTLRACDDLVIIRVWN